MLLQSTKLRHFVDFNDRVKNQRDDIRRQESSDTSVITKETHKKTLY